MTLKSDTAKFFKHQLSSYKKIIYRCEQEQHRGDVCSFYPSPTNYQMAITNESQIILKLLSDITNNTGRKCNQFITFAVCFYLFRSCELRNVSDPTSGSQLTICPEKCAGIDKLIQECSDISVKGLLMVVENSQLEVLRNIIPSSQIKCSSPDTYIVPQVPVSNRLCDNASYIDSLLPSEGTLSFTSTILNVLVIFFMIPKLMSPN